MLGGLFEQNYLRNPSTIMPCMDEYTAADMVAFIGDTLNKLAKGSINDFIACYNKTKDYHNTLPQ